MNIFMAFFIFGLFFADCVGSENGNYVQQSIEDYIPAFSRPWTLADELKKEISSCTYIIGWHHSVMMQKCDYYIDVLNELKNKYSNSLKDSAFQNETKEGKENCADRDSLCKLTCVVAYKQLLSVKNELKQLFEIAFLESLNNVEAEKFASLVKSLFFISGYRIVDTSDGIAYLPASCLLKKAQEKNIDNEKIKQCLTLLITNKDDCTMVIFNYWNQNDQNILNRKTPYIDILQHLLALKSSLSEPGN